MKNPHHYRARIAVLPEFVDMAMRDNNQLEAAQFRLGFVPPHQAKTVEMAIEQAEHNFPNTPLTDLELATLDTYFTIHPENIAGVQIGGTSFLAPVSTKGNKQDILNMFAFLDVEPVAVISDQSSVVSEEAVLETQTANKEQLMLKARALMLVLRLKRKNEKS